MNKQITRRAALATMGMACGLFLAGCSKKARLAVDLNNPYQHLPGATNILASVDQKNYDEAVAALVKLREFASTEEQLSEYALLSRTVKDKLLEAATTDEKASSALQALRVMTTGR
jgi:uncharacterized UBP type Zn finger protein